MAAYATFTSARTTMPDPIAITAAIRTATGDPTAVLFFDGQFFRGKKADPWSPAQLAEAQTIIDTTAAATPQQEAQRTIDSYPIHFRALVLALIDELNILRQHPAIGLAPRTPAQAITAIRNKAGTLS